MNRLDTLENLVRVARGELDKALKGVEKAEGAAKVRIEHEDIGKHSTDIRRIQNGRTAFDGSVKTCRSAKQSLKAQEDPGRHFERPRPDWDEGRLEEFDLSIAVRQEITQHGDRLRDAFAEHSSRRSDLRQNIVALEEATDAESKSRRELDAFAVSTLDAEQIRKRRNLVRAARSQLAEIGQLRQNVLNLQGQLEGLENTTPQVGGDKRSRTIAAVAFVIGIALLIGGAVLGGTALSSES